MLKKISRVAGTKLFLATGLLALLAASCSTTPPPDYTKQLDAISAQLAKLNDKPAEKNVSDELTGYQAVFLTNGQVYFGKVSDFNSQYVRITDIYYMQVSPSQGGVSSPENLSQSAVSLIKLGNEIHGPQDQMFISRSNVLFVENLRDDGQVVQAIMADKRSRTK